MENNSEPRQIKRGKEPKANRRWLFLILALTILISFLFYLVAGQKQDKEKNFEFNLGKPKVYEF